MKGVVLELDKIRVKVEYDDNSILQKTLKEFGDYIKPINYNSDEDLFTISFSQMKSLLKDKGENIFYDKEPKDKHYNKVSILSKGVAVEYDPRNDFQMFSSYIILNSMSKLFENSGYFVLHSSCVEKNNKAVAFSGKKGAGKTQTLINLLQSGYHMVTNDKLALRLDNDGKIICVGFPTSVGIRMTHSFVDDPKNADIVKTLKQKDREKLKPADVSNLADESKKFFIHPRVITNGYKTDITPVSILTQIVNPTFVPGKEKFESKKTDLRDVVDSQREPAVSIEKPYLNNISYVPFLMDTSKIVNAMVSLSSNISVLQGPGQTENLIDVMEK